MRRRLGVLGVCVWFLSGCTPMPIPTATPIRIPTREAVTTPRATVIARPPSPVPSATPGPTPPLNDTPAQPTPRVPTPSSPPSFLAQRIANLFDLSRLPLMEGSIATQFTSRNWTSLEHYFDYFPDDGAFASAHYGYIAEDGSRESYRVVTGYDGLPEFEIVPRVPGPGAIDRIWFAYQQHQSLNNPRDMSQAEEWSNWGNLGAMGKIRFYFDDEPTPRIDWGIKELFVGKKPFPAPLAAFYASANGGNINYVPIPFQRSIRVTTTGRPRLMQIQVKRFASAPAPTLARVASNSNSAATVQSVALELSASEHTALDQAAAAWRNCAAARNAEYAVYPLSIPHNNSAEVVFDAPATITSLRIRVPRGMEDSVWMQVFWDGELEPSMTAPLRGMFGTAEKLFPYRSLPMGIVDTETETIFYNNFPMPFRSARLVLINDRAETLPATFEIASGATLPGTENARLHAYYGTRRVEKREDDGDNYVVIDVKGSGKYLGLILSAWELDRRAAKWAVNDNWRFPYLESNVDVWVDGRLALPGTGIEDDFNASYYYVFAGYEGYKTTYCLAGLTLLDYSTWKEPSSQYRFYLNDAPEFRHNLRVEVQHGNKGNNLSITYSSTAFWYQMR